MSLVSKPSLSAVWSADAEGICADSQQIPAGLMPSMKGVALGAWLDSALADDDPEVAVQLSAALEGAAPFSMEIAINCTDGAARRVIFSGLPACDGASGVRYSGFILDITEQHRALAKAMLEAAKYRLLVEHSTDLIAHCNAKGIYTSISPSYSKMMGWSAAEMVGMPVVDFLHPDDRGPAKDALVHLFNGGVLPDVVEVRKRHRDGHYITLDTNASSVIHPGAGRSIGAVLVSRDITRDKQRIQELERRASCDTLTGLPNRASISDRINAMLMERGERAYATLLFIDLNGFKAVNDSMGHAAGDVLLCDVSKRLKRCMRPGDSIGRLGGDEFVVAAKCCDRDAAASVAQRLLDSLNAPFSINGTDVRIGAAIGISLGRIGTASVKCLFEQADTAMYQAKARRDGSYQFFEQ